jgi:hypothetical protein
MDRTGFGQAFYTDTESDLKCKGTNWSTKIKIFVCGKKSF